MGLYPESVHLERMGIESGLSIHATDYLTRAGLTIPLAWDINYPNNFSGEDHICNERIGRASVRVNAEMLADNIRFIKEDTEAEKWLLDEYQKGW